MVALSCLRSSEAVIGNQEQSEMQELSRRTEGDVTRRKPAKPRIGWGPLDFVSVGLAAASGRLPLDAFMAYLHAKPAKKNRRAR